MESFKRAVYEIFRYLSLSIFDTNKTNIIFHVNMSNSLASKIYNFLTTSPMEHITAFSVVYQAMEDNPWIEQDVLRSIVNGAISLAKNDFSQDLLAQNKLLTVSLQVSQ